MINTFLEKFLVLSFAALFFLAMATACTPAEIEGSFPATETPTSEAVADSVNPLIDTNWNLVGIGGEGFDGEATLTFSAESVGGNDGCNNFGSDYSVVDGALVINANGFFRNEMGCENSIMQAADRYLDALATAGAFRIDGDQLVIESDAGEMVFEKPISAELTNTRWQLSGLTTGDGAMMHMAIDDAIFMQIDDAGMVSGNGGCNGFGGEATIDGNKLMIGNTISTMMACAEEDKTMRESEFFAALATSDSYEILRNSLSLYDANGDLVATFAATEAPEAEAMIKTIFVGAEQVDCVGVAPMKCLLVRENADGEYTYFYDAIEGFQWEAGFEYELLVAVSEVENPPADGSSLRYELIELVAKLPVEMIEDDGDSLSLENSSWQLLHSIVGGDAVVPPPADSDIFITFADGAVSGNAGCNSLNGVVEIDGSAIAFGRLATSRMACGEALDGAERAFLEMLENVTEFSIENGKLTLLNQGLALAEFVVK